MKVLDYVLPKLILGFLIGIIVAQYIVLNTPGQMILYTCLAVFSVTGGVWAGTSSVKERSPKSVYVWQLRMVGSAFGGFLFGVIVMSLF